MTKYNMYISYPCLVFLPQKETKLTMFLTNPVQLTVIPLSLSAYKQFGSITCSNIFLETEIVLHDTAPQLPLFASFKDGKGTSLVPITYFPRIHEINNSSKLISRSYNYQFKSCFLGSKKQVLYFCREIKWELKDTLQIQAEQLSFWFYNYQLLTATITVKKLEDSIL